MNEISAQKIAAAISAMKAIDSAWLTPGQHVSHRLITDLQIARLDLESSLTGVNLNLKEAA